jgi:hypothetical protein
MRIVRVVAAGVIACSLLVLVAGPAAASCPGTKRYANGVNHKVWGTSSIPAGWNTSVNAGRAAWNGISGGFTFQPFVANASGPMINGVWVGRISFRAAALPDIPGITFPGTGTQNANVYLNSDFVWNTSGVMQQSTRRVDVRTVATHELGHVPILRHPGDCGAMTSAEVAAVMHPNWTTKVTPNTDDRAGLKALYG